MKVESLWCSNWIFYIEFKDKGFYKILKIKEGKEIHTE